MGSTYLKTPVAKLAGAKWDEAFAHRVSANGACLEFTGARDSAGYGRLRFRGVWSRAHRLAHYLAAGELPPVVRHTCDNPPCVNPAHLLGGTHADNLADARARGRAAFQVDPAGYAKARSQPRPQNSRPGPANPFARFTADQVREIRTRHNAGQTYARLAIDYASCVRTIGTICRRESYRNVGDVQ